MFDPTADAALAPGARDPRAPGSAPRSPPAPPATLALPPPPSRHTLAPEELGRGRLTQFAYFAGDFGDHVAQLASKTMPEVWKKTDANGREHEFGVLENYLHMIFKFIVDTQPDKLKKAGDFVVFDTRLLAPFSLSLERVYALFSRNRNPGRQPWFFLQWATGWGEVVSKTVDHATRERAFGSRPVEPFSIELSTNRQPEWWKEFKLELPFFYNVQHILKENRERMRALCAAPGGGGAPPSDDELATKLTAALETARRFAALNARRVLPQLFLPGGIGGDKGVWNRQLLMPLHLRALPAADCALTVELVRDPDNPGGWMYEASTLLPLNDAYNNARMCNSVESPWLQRIINEQREEIEGLTAQLAALNAP